jgi:hypothetical protein
MKTLLSILLAALLAAPASAGGRRRTAVSAPGGGVTIAFVGVSMGSGADAVLDAGRLSKTQRRTFGIRLDGPGKTATLRASLETVDAQCTVRVDGIVLGLAPKTIAAHAPLGSVATHTLEIEVLASAPEGAFAAAVRWEVSTN